MNLMRLYKEKEPSTSESISRLSRILQADFGLLTSFQREPQHHDEPRFWYFSSHLNHAYKKHDGLSFHSRASGFSFSSPEDALLKCLAESIERYCNFAFFKNSVSFVGSVGEAKKRLHRAAEIESFARFSERQLGHSAYQPFRFTDDSVLRWTLARNMFSNEQVLLPCQLLFLSYPPLEKEPLLYPSISTGVAGGSSLSAALLRGIYEIVERDAFMIFYLNKIPAAHISLQTIKDNRVKQLRQTGKRYKLDIVCLDMTTDVGIPVVSAIVLDKTGIGKAVSIGLKSNIDRIEAVVGAISEAFHTRGWIRKEYEKNPVSVTPERLRQESDILARAFLWYPLSSIAHLDFWLRSSSSVNLSNGATGGGTGHELRLVLAALRKKKYAVYWKDMTLPAFKKMNFFVTKVIIPEFQPLYLNEKYPLLGGKRLYAVPVGLGFSPKTEEQLNQYPHPFL